MVMLMVMLMVMPDDCCGYSGCRLNAIFAEPEVNEA